MRKTSVMLVAAMLLLSGNIFAKESKETDPSKDLKNQVRQLLDEQFELTSYKKLEASILFTVNKENEIVVLSVYTESDKLERFVKSKLNYHQIRTAGVVQGRRYTIPIKVES